MTLRWRTPSETAVYRESECGRYTVARSGPGPYRYMAFRVGQSDRQPTQILGCYDTADEAKRRAERDAEAGV